MKDVHISMLLADLIPFFMERRRVDVLHLMEKIGNADREGVRHIAHCIKGTSGSYGFDVLGDLAAELEEKAQDAPFCVLKSLLCQIEDYLDQVRIVYDHDQEGSETA